MLFKEQEVKIEFYASVDSDGWDASEVFVFETNGIISYSSASISPAVNEDFGSLNVRIFLKKFNKENVESLNESDIAVIGDAKFEISKIDDRAVLPSKYPIRIEAVRKI